MSTILDERFGRCDQIVGVPLELSVQVLWESRYCILGRSWEYRRDVGEREHNDAQTINIEAR